MTPGPAEILHGVLHKKLLEKKKKKTTLKERRGSVKLKKKKTKGITNFFFFFPVLSWGKMGEVPFFFWGPTSFCA